MKESIKKIIKIAMQFIILSLILYIFLTINDFVILCNRYQINIVKNEEEQFINIQDDEINELGVTIEKLSDSTKEHFKGTKYENYNSTGIAVWKVLQVQINGLVRKNIEISLVLSVCLIISYQIFYSQRLSFILKFILGYFGILIIVPPIYMFRHTGRGWEIITMYLGIPGYFYIIYILILIVIIVTNYINSRKISRELNNTL